MKTIFKHIEGDKTIWAIVAILAIFSFMPVYSASTNLVYVVGSGSTFGHLVKHMVLLIMGFAIIYGVHKIPYRYFSGGAVLMLPIVIVLLVFTLAQGTTIGGANASKKHLHLHLSTHCKGELNLSDYEKNLHPFL